MNNLLRAVHVRCRTHVYIEPYTEFATLHFQTTAFSTMMKWQACRYVSIDDQNPCLAAIRNEALNEASWWDSGLNQISTTNWFNRPRNDPIMCWVGRYPARTNHSRSFIERSFDDRNVRNLKPNDRLRSFIDCIWLFMSKHSNMFRYGLWYRRCCMELDGSLKEKKQLHVVRYCSVQFDPEQIVKLLFWSGRVLGHFVAFDLYWL